MSRGFGIYLHLPFCTHRCSYCDFFSSAKFTSSSFDSVAEAIRMEIRAQGAEWQGKTKPLVDSVFLGGGTPSLFSVGLLAGVFEELRQYFPLRDAAEITMECNPETLSAEYLAAIRRDTPVNRISMGAQSFEPRHLKTLERLCSADQVKRAVGLVRAAGFENFNLDLIFAIPGQTLPEVVSDIETAASLGPTHISCYQLTLGSTHKLYASLPDEDFQTDAYELAAATLEKHGYGCYEISNFAKPGHKCVHNLLYWTGGDFLGIGPSASSRIFKDGVFHHRKQIADMAKYVAAPVPPNWEACTSEQTVLEASFLEMRTDVGVRAEDFFGRYGFDLRKSRKLPLFKEKGMVVETDGFLRLTSKGRLLADGISRDLTD